MLEAKLFGSVTFLVGGKPVKGVPTRAAQALLIYLLHQPHPIERERLIDMFYQASTPKQASANFRSTLSRIRKELAPYLSITSRTVGINTDAEVWIDSAEFDQLFQQGKWQEAIRLYQNEFLAGFHLRDAPEFETWALVERERLRLLALEGLQRLVAGDEQRGDYWAGLRHVNQLLGIEPLLEQAQRYKLNFLARTGQRAAALQHYQVAAQLFERELGIELSAETTTLHKRITRLRVPPPLVLPASVGEFIGRNSEIADLTNLLNTRRLITLFGIGGTGKTRLAVETARQLASTGRFLDGLYFVPLIGADSADALALQLMQTLNITIVGRQPPQDEALAGLREREALLILDNFEHLLPNAVDFVARLLTEAPSVKLLVTSRERLNLMEESVFDVSGLPFATPDSDANQLFIAHAQRHRFTFAPTPTEKAGIVRICYLLEGNPLGIALAAGSIRDLDCNAIAQRIADNLTFLASPFRNIPERHRSLRAVFLHSWALLTDELRPILADLAVFADSFSAESAHAIVGATAEQLSALVDKALLQESDGRFALHPLLRQFSAEQQTNPTTIATQHASHFLHAIPAQADHFLTTGKDTLQADVPNLRTAWEHVLLSADGDLLSIALSALHDYWRTRSWNREGLERMTRTRNLFATVDLRVYQQSIAYQADFLWALGNMEEAIKYFEEAIDGFSAELALNDTLHSAYANALAGLGMCHYFTGKPEQALDAIEQAVAIYRDLEDYNRLGHTLGKLMTIRSGITGELPPYSDIEQAIALVVYPRMRSDLFNYYGRVCNARGDYAKAVSVFEEANKLSRQIGHQTGIASTLVNMGVSALYSDQLGVAERTSHEALTLFEESGDQFGLQIAHNTLGMVAAQRGKFEEAISQLEKAYGLAVAMESKTGQALTLTNLADCLAAVNSASGQHKSQLVLTTIQQATSKIEATQVRKQMCGFMPRLASALMRLGYGELAVTVATAANHHSDLEHSEQNTADTVLQQASRIVTSAQYDAAVMAGKEEKLEVIFGRIYAL